MPEQKQAVSNPGVANLDITVVYDNNPAKEGLSTGWGFSAILADSDKTILFDTAWGPPLLDNMQTLQIDPKSTHVVALSHIHADHTGGLHSLLEVNANVTVYMPKSFPERFKDRVTPSGAQIVDVTGPLKICQNVYSTGPLGRRIQEQSLIVRTEAGMIITTGCAHPGILNIVNRARELVKDNILLVMGGLHLEWARKGRIERIISAFDEWGVRYVALGHCAGHKSRTIFEKRFGNNYINIGAGKVITTADLQ